MLIRYLLYLYPAQWRERYADEFVAMLEQYQLSPGDYLDIMRSALAMQFEMHTQTIATILKIVAGAGVILSLMSLNLFLILLPFAKDGTASEQAAEFFLLVSPLPLLLTSPYILWVGSQKSLTRGLILLGFITLAVYLNRETGGYGTIMIGAGGICLSVISFLAWKQHTQPIDLALAGITAGGTLTIAMGLQHLYWMYHSPVIGFFGILANLVWILSQTYWAIRVFRWIAFRPAARLQKA